MWTHTLKKTLLLCACVHVKCSEGSATAACNELWSGKSADAADVTGIPCFVKMRWRVEMGKRNSGTRAAGQRQDGKHQQRTTGVLGGRVREGPLQNQGVRILGVPYDELRRAGNNGGLALGCRPQMTRAFGAQSAGSYGSSGVDGGD
jgi:hypothetical protein